ncbi:MAG TPA: AMIN domain-containing protein, partial [Clostridiales bacterium]|nr:AMIN domain-containing protein [Clostridiales bacterium]
MRKYLVFIMLVCVMVLGAVFPAFGAQGGQSTIDVVDGTTQKKHRVHVVSLKIDGKDVVGDVPAILHQDRTLVPIRLVVESLGAEVYWDQRTYQVTIQTEDKKIVLKINSGQASVNGKTVSLPDGVPPKLYGYQGSYRTMVPLRFVSETLGYEVNWIESTRTVAVNSSGSSKTPVSPPAAQVVRVKGIDYDISENKSKVLIKLSGKADVTPSYLQGSKYGGSDRLVLDIADCEFDESIGKDKLFEKAVYKGGIMKIRGSLFQVEPKKITRIVIDLDSPKEYSVEFDENTNTICARFLNSVTDVRVEKRYNADAVVIRAKETPAYNVMKLGNRLVIDILNAKLDFNKNQISVSKGGVSRVRIAPFTPDSNYDPDDKIVRVVLDLDSGKTPDDFLVEREGNDIVIYLSGQPLKGFDYQKKTFKRSTATLSLEKSVRYDVEYDENASELTITVPKDAANLEKSLLEIYDDIIEYVRIKDSSNKEYEIIFKLADGTDYTLETKSSRSDKIVVRFDNKNLEEPKYAGRLVVIDAGHGGKDPGAISPNLKLNEKDLTLDTAQRVERLLKEAGFDTYMTRDSDVYVGLSDRANAANVRNAAVFVSIHYNAHSNSEIKGIQVLYNGNDPTRDNKTFAQIMMEEMCIGLGAPDKGVVNRPNLVVIRDTKMP